jgi:hypothetical protein
MLGKQDVVVRVGVEGRVKVHKIDGLVVYVTAHDFQIVAVVEIVLRA